MNKYSNIYLKNITLKNLYDVYNKVYKTCKNKKEVFNFNLNKNTNLYDIYLKLLNNSYKFRNYKLFLIRDPKYRLIMSECIRDKIVNHFVAEYYLIQYLEPSLINANVATRKDKGGKMAHVLFESFIRKLKLSNKKIYCLKIDISKYFYSVHHKVLIKLLKKKIDDKNVIDTIKTILSTTTESYINESIRILKSKEIARINKFKISSKEKAKKINEIEKIPYYSYESGLPIGNMTSQILAIYYLNELDHYIKENLKIKYYVRYMDDLVIVANDLDELKNIKSLICEKIAKYRLEVNKKSKIFDLSKGVEFLGYRYILKNNKTFIRYNKQTIKRINRRLKNLKRFDIHKYCLSLGSYKGYLMKCNTSLYKDKFKEYGSKEMRLKEKYNYYKVLYKDSVVVIKEGLFYKTTDVDAKIIWKIFGYKIIKDVVGFPTSSLEKVIDRLKWFKINLFIVNDEDDMQEIKNEINNYEPFLNTAIYEYVQLEKKENILQLIERKLFEKEDNYDEVREFLEHL